MNTRLAANMAVNAMKVLTKAGGRVAGYGGRGAEMMGTAGLGRSIERLGMGAGNFIQGLSQGGSMGFGSRAFSGTGARTMLNAPGRGLMAQGARDIRAGGAGMWNWAAGGSMGQRAARLGGGYAAGRGAADFMTPWGLGWGD